MKTIKESARHRGVNPRSNATIHRFAAVNISVFYAITAVRVWTGRSCGCGRTRRINLAIDIAGGLRFRITVAASRDNVPVGRTNDTRAYLRLSGCAHSRRRRVS